MFSKMSELKSNNHSKNKIAIFLRGGTAVGKTTIAKLLAKKINPSVHIEQDNLRYMVVSGLVASRIGLHPRDYPEEYKKQCKLADKNTLALVRNFTDEGYIVIVDGFNGGESGDTFYYLKNPQKIKWYPKTELLERELPDIRIIQIVLDTEKVLLIKRLKEVKLWNNEVIDFILKQREIFLKSLETNEFHYKFETSKMSPEEICMIILQKLW